MRRILFFIALLGAVAVVALSVLYRWFDTKAYEVAMRENMSPAMANGIKHAYAAAALFGVLRGVGVGVDTSVSVVIGAGELSEYAERLVKRPADSTAEVAKDLHNNYIGVVAAQWLEKHPHADAHTPLSVVVQLARAGVIAAHPKDVVSGYSVIAAPSKVPDVARAMGWFDNHSVVIVQRVNAALGTLSLHKHADELPVL